MRPYFHQVLIILILGGIYSLTIAPDLTWSHFSADGGDLIAATAVNGVPHPAGYPLYLILAKVFQFLPIGSLAFRTNLFSAVCVILTSLFLFSLINEHLKENPFHDQLALLGALAYGLAPAVWGQALVTEVYALHGLLVALCLYAFLRPNFPEWTRGFIFGLAATNHITSVFLFPLLFLYGNTKKSMLRLAGVLSGLLLYLILPLRAFAHPPVNWGNASTLSGFIWLVSGGGYRDYVLQLSFSDILSRLGFAAGLALDQFTILGLFLALYALLAFRASRLFVATYWTSFIYLFFSVVYASYDSHVYLIGLWLCIAIWIPIGLGDLLQNFCQRSVHTAQLISSFMIVLLLARIPYTYAKVNLSHDLQAQEFIVTTFEKIPKNAIVFVTGDEQIFSLWYAQFALHRREDVIIIAEDLLQFEWYLDNLRQTYFSNIIVPFMLSAQPSDLVAENHSRPVCYLHVGKEIDCSEK